MRLVRKNTAVAARHWVRACACDPAMFSQPVTGWYPGCEWREKPGQATSTVRFRSPHLHERQADHHSQDQDSATVRRLLARGCNFGTARTRRVRTPLPRGEPGLRMTCGTRLHWADDGGRVRSPVWNRSACLSRGTGNRPRSGPGKVRQRFAPRHERSLAETVTSTGRRSTGSAS